jgi:hypothetical protein
MVLDMEGEFYKLAKRILSSPKKLFRMAALSPQTGRVTLMGADNYVVAGSSMMRSFTKTNDRKAYLVGKRTGKEMLGSLIKEFDEEVSELPPRKLFDIALPFCRSTGWGEFDLISLNEKEGTVVIKGKETIELKYSRAVHHMLTCGLITGMATTCLRREIEGSVTSTDSEEVTFQFKPA